LGAVPPENTSVSAFEAVDGRVANSAITLHYSPEGDMLFKPILQAVLDCHLF